MTPARLIAHDQQLEVVDDKTEAQRPSGPDRAGRIESNAQLDGVVQRKGEAESAEHEGGELEEDIASMIQSERGRGRPLDPAVRQSAEQTLGYDLSMARVHTGPTADKLSRQVGAIAFTSGRDIFVGSKGSASDAALMTHELTHTVQQGFAETKPSAIGAADTAHEHAAEAGAATPGNETAVQRYVDDRQIKGQYARVSENGNVVVLGQENYSQNLYATAEMIDQANGLLKASGQKGSYLSLIRTGATLAYGGKSLAKVAPVYKGQGDGNNADLDKANKGKDEDDKMSLWADCGRSSRVVMGSHGDQAPHATYGMGDGKEHDTPASYMPSDYSNKIYCDAMPPFLQDKSHADYLKKGIHYNANPSDVILPKDADQARAQYEGLTEPGKKAFDAFAKINTGANPNVGGGYTLNTERKMPGFKEKGSMTWNFHWAGCVMKDGTDNITLENYADGNGYESINTDWNFQMYGTVKKGQTFYEQHLASNTHGSKATAFQVEPEGS